MTTAAPAILDPGQRVAPRGAPATIAFTVSGKPAPQGSMKAFVRAGKAVVIHDNASDLDSWREVVRAGATVAMRGRAPFRGPIAVALVFSLVKPKSWTGTSPYQHKRPDIDKLTRSILDALTTVCFEDDAQVAVLYAEKKHAPGAWHGVAITVKELRT